MRVEPDVAETDLFKNPILIMNNATKAEQIMKLAIDQFSLTMFEDATITFSAGTRLMGEDAVLDSMGFVNLVTAIEDALQMELGLCINLAEEIQQATGSGNKSLESVKELTEFIEYLIVSRGKQK